MIDLPSRWLPGALRLMRANRIFVSDERARRHVAEMAVHPARYGPPRRLLRHVTVDVDHGPGWPVYTLTPRGGRPRGAVVYVHGGGWVNQIVRQHWELAAQIAVGAGTTVRVPIYPLVPFGTAGAVVPAVAALVRDAAARYGTCCLGGDSAGGQIALSAAVVLRDEHGLQVPRTVLIAPALDLSLTNPGIDEVQPTDPWLGRPGTRVFVEHWRGGLPLDDPRVSPLAADLAGLGPLTVVVGTRDIVLPDARLLAATAASAGVDVDHREGHGLLHVYPLTPTPEGRAARGVIVEQLRSALPGA